MNAVFEQAMADFGKSPDEPPTTSQPSTKPDTGADGKMNKGRRTSKVAPIDHNRKSGENNTKSANEKADKEDNKKQGKTFYHICR